MTNEKVFKASSGYFSLILSLVLLLSPFANIVFLDWFIPVSVVLAIAGFFGLIGLVTVQPNSSCVLVLFGKYKGTIKDNGFFWVNPFYSRKKVSLRVQNLDSQQMKVNDKLGNPIMIGAVIVWKVEDTHKAAFDVEDYHKFVGIQCESAIRRLASHYAYDSFEEEHEEVTLRSGGEEVNHILEHEISERLVIAGIKVVEARISYLAYAPEIAGAMLQRQQATAVLAARYKIVEGAVSMVEMTLENLKKKNIVELTESQKASLVTNLMVVLCAEKPVNPIVETGANY